MYAPEALRLALRKEVAARDIEARERGVGGGIARAREREFERVGHVAHDEAVLVFLHVFIGHAVDLRADEFELLADQREIGGAGCRRIAAHAQRAAHHRAGGHEIELERDSVDQESGRRVVGAADHGRRGGVGHGHWKRWARKWGSRPGSAMERAAGTTDRSIVQRLRAVVRCPAVRASCRCRTFPALGRSAYYRGAQGARGRVPANQASPGCPASRRSRKTRRP